ncbi:hypothetical protein HJC23_006805 [Cyclotella cryptica]|uniref:Uncharacterized protein n=1 Tax=Cyclotella cryptica TaxID=29204 RepID=A0ABD3PJL7_9STRA|eukprot:CCRYP_015139-RA/>CCRYP_015139-RA protein AED:0.05 eAED:0.05 QI:110/1/1/1/0/0/2/749/379
MSENTPVRRTKSESSFLQSLAYIHMEARSKRQSPNNNAVWDIKQATTFVVSKNDAARSMPSTQRRASAFDVAQAVSRHHSVEMKKNAPPCEKESVDFQGISKSRDIGKETDVPISSQRRVSFSHQDCTLRRVMSDFNIKSLPKNSPNFSSSAGRGSVPTSSNALMESSMKSSFERFHLSSPRPFPVNDNDRGISSMSLRGDKISLRSHSTPTFELLRPCRRYSMLEERMRRQEKGLKENSLTGVPTPSASLQRRKSDGANSDNVHQKTAQNQCCNARKDYSLGEVARSNSHMIIESCPQKALHRASKLKNHDFAFVKRMDGSWTYAILAYRSFVDGNTDSSDECMMFVMNEKGSTKTIKRRQWAEFVRCVVKEEGVGPE